MSFSVLCENPTLRTLAILPPSGSYDPELPSTTWQMIGYLAFRLPFPLCSHALCTSGTHSLHLYNNFLFLYLLVWPVFGSCTWLYFSCLDRCLLPASFCLSDLPLWAKRKYASSSRTLRKKMAQCFESKPSFESIWLSCLNLTQVFALDSVLTQPQKFGIPL